LRQFVAGGQVGQFRNAPYWPKPYFYVAIATKLSIALYKSMVVG